MSPVSEIRSSKMYLEKSNLRWTCPPKSLSHRTSALSGESCLEHRKCSKQNQPTAESRSCLPPTQANTPPADLFMLKIIYSKKCSLSAEHSGSFSSSIIRLVGGMGWGHKQGGQEAGSRAVDYRHNNGWGFLTTLKWSFCV